MRQKLTNRLNLSMPLVEAAQNDDYDPGRSDYTATSLLQPARMRQLVRMFPDQCVEDVSEVTDRLLGQAVHVILERAAGKLQAEGYISEKRFYGRFAWNDRIFVVSAKIDIYDPAKAHLDDYKTDSVFAVLYGLKSEYSWQVNLQSELMRRDGLPVETAGIVHIFKDWKRKQAQVRADYPEAPSVRQAVPLLLPEEVTAWVVSRIAAHETAAKAETQAELPLCTDPEMWARTSDDTFAVKKPGATRASALCDTRAEAEAYIAARPGQGLVVEQRFGEANRCPICPGRRACDQWKSSPRNPANSSSGGQASKKRGDKEEGWGDLPDGLVSA